MPVLCNRLRGGFHSKQASLDSFVGKYPNSMSVTCLTAKTIKFVVFPETFERLGRVM